MTRHTPESFARSLGRRAVQLTLAGAVAATPLGLATAMAPAANAETDWDALAECESSGNWSTNTGNGFGGGLQFTDSTWKAFGGSGQPEDASRSQQIQVAERVKAGQGMNAWPTCSKKTGQTSSAANSGSDSDSDSSESTSTESTSSTSKSKSTAKSESSDEGSDEKKSVRSTSSESTSSTSSERSESTSSSRSGSYTVVAGDTLTRIAQRQGLSGGASALAERNDIADPDLIIVGQKLVLS